MSVFLIGVVVGVLACYVLSGKITALFSGSPPVPPVL